MLQNYTALQTILVQFHGRVFNTDEFHDRSLVKTWVAPPDCRKVIFNKQCKLVGSSWCRSIATCTPPRLDELELCLAVAADLGVDVQRLWMTSDSVQWVQQQEYTLAIKKHDRYQSTDIERMATMETQNIWKDLGLCVFIFDLGLLGCTEMPRNWMTTIYWRYVEDAHRQ